VKVASFIVTCLLIPALLHAQDASSQYTANHQRQALDIYRTVIGFRTAEGHGQVPKMASYLEDLFRAGGFAAGDVHVLPLKLESGEETASLVVRYRGSNASGKKPVLFLAHMDVVDAKREDWTRDPFTLVEEVGYFFGRGTLDDKSGVTLLTTTFLRLKAEGFVPARDLIIAFTGDEETGQLTTEALVTTHRALTDAEFALNADAGGGVLDESGKPTSYLMQMSEKTYATFEVTVTNPGGHSSLPRADNAIYQLADVLKRIEGHRFPVQINDATRLYFQNAAQITEGEAGQAMARLAKNAKDRAAADILWRYPEYVGVTRTTCIATMLRGGHAENALPQSATATVNCRVFPGVEVSEVLTTLQGLAQNPAVRVTMLGNPQASAPSPLNEDVMRAVSRGLAKIRPGTPVIPYMAPYATDGSILRRAGIPTYGTIGLFVKASDDFSHGLNERVSVRSFFDALEYWHVVMTDLAGR
jgi:acetylornithine deacetylase/succinyl-diaminopimelate desuccinylase-like protein